jgi:hypothetical protein
MLVGRVHETNCNWGPEVSGEKGGCSPDEEALARGAFWEASGFVQKALGKTSDEVARRFFDGPDGAIVLAALRRYVRREMTCGDTPVDYHRC